jgi:hypothetical protein
MGRVDVGSGVSLGVTGNGVSVGVLVMVGVQVAGIVGGPTVGVLVGGAALIGTGTANGPARLGAKNNVV